MTRRLALLLLAVLPFALTPGDGFGFLRLSADGARAFVDASFGGPGRSGPGGAPLTDVERRSAVWPLRLFLTEWNALWEAFGECAFNADEIGGADAHFSSAAGEPHVVAGFDWSIGETTGRLEARRSVASGTGMSWLARRAMS